MLTNAQEVIWQPPMLAIYPGLLILLTVASCNLLGDALQEALDPRRRSSVSGRLVKAFAAAGITPILVSCVGAVIWAMLTSRQIGAMARFALPVTLVVAVPTAIGFTLLIAVPAHYIASRLRRTSQRFYVLGGAVIALIVAFLCLLDFQHVPPTNYEEWIFNTLTLVIVLISGPLSAFVFWKIARPDLRTIVKRRAATLAAAVRAINLSRPIPTRELPHAGSLDSPTLRRRLPGPYRHAGPGHAAHRLA